MNRSFKQLFNECSEEARRKIGEIISKNLHFSKYFYNDNDEVEIHDDLYDNCKVNEILKNKKLKNLDKILEFCFKSQKGNSLLIITFFAQKKIEQKGFMEELEKNYGIYLDVDNFIKEMNQKFKEIKSFKEMFNYIGSEFGSDKDDLELLIEGYERAKEKGYIRVYDNRNNLNSSQSFRGGVGYRGRGRGGRGRGERGRGERGRGGRGIGRGRGRGRGRVLSFPDL